MSKVQDPDRASKGIINAADYSPPKAQDQQSVSAPQSNQLFIKNGGFHNSSLWCWLLFVCLWLGWLSFI